MDAYQVRGGRRLRGEISIGGAKNAILPILAATMLHKGASVVHNCPNIADTRTSVRILEALGARVSARGGTLTVDAAAANVQEVPDALVREMRSSFIFLGSVLARFGEVRIGYPGGCKLGLRPVDLHLKALRQMGVEITIAHGVIECKAKQLRPGRINLDFPSVGATENVMLAATAVRGETIITNAAREPEIADLQKFLISMGARVRGAGTDEIVIQGGQPLRDAEHAVMPDRIVAGTYMAAAAITGGEITLHGTDPGHLRPIAAALAEAGCHITSYGDRVVLKAPPQIRAIDRLRTGPHPGFPTDMQPQMSALLSVASGASLIEEKLFESRNKHIGELNRMGADILLSQDGTLFVVKGVKSLKGATVYAKDLRGGAALILAALAAEGESTITGARHVERGYERIDDVLRALGADIQHVRSG